MEALYKTLMLSIIIISKWYVICVVKFHVRKYNASRKSSKIPTECSHIHI